MSQNSTTPRRASSRRTQGEVLGKIVSLVSSANDLFKICLGVGLAGIFTGAGWWLHAAINGDLPVLIPQVIAPPLSFSSRPEVDLDATHPIVLASFLANYSSAAFDTNGNSLSPPPANALRRLGYSVHYAATPATFGDVIVKYFLSEATAASSLNDVVLERLASEQRAVLVDRAHLLQDRLYQRYFFIERPRDVRHGEELVVQFYEPETPTPTEQPEQLIASVTYPLYPAHEVRR
jgi:hypothetical protein